MNKETLYATDEALSTAIDRFESEDIQELFKILINSNPEMKD